MNHNVPTPEPDSVSEYVIAHFGDVELDLTDWSFMVRDVDWVPIADAEKLAIDLQRAALYAREHRTTKEIQ